MGSAMQLRSAPIHSLWRGAVWASAMVGVMAGAAPISSLYAGLAAVESHGANQAFLNFLNLARVDSGSVASLQDILIGDEVAADAAELTAPPASRRHPEMVDALLSDRDSALQLLQEGGEPETFLASRHADPGLYMTLALANQARTALY